MKRVIIPIYCFLILLACSYGSFAQKPGKNPPREMKSDTLKDVTVVSKCRQIIGYYPSWQMYKRGGLVTPMTFRYDKYTILNYSFFQCDTLGNLFGTDFWADSILLRGKYDWSTDPPSYIPNTNLIDWAHIYGVKVMVSIGGWTLSDNFPTVAADPKRRAHFAQECVRILKDYKFDGIDIDWEYPGYAEHKGTPDDKVNFTLLMKAIRDSIDAYGDKIKYSFLLTGAFGANESTMENIEWDKIKDIMDYINMMTYDFNGSWNEEANHNSPLYSPKSGGQGSLDLAFKLMTEKYDVPPHKLNMGVAYYGRTLLGKNKDERLDLFGTEHKAAPDSITFPEDIGQPQYFNILYKMNKFEKRWDSIAQVPYLIGKNKNTFVSYDDEESVRLKAEYVVNKGAAGVIIWDCTGDIVETRPGSGRIKGTPLTDVLFDVLRPCKKKPIRKRYK
ncbi:MAG: glycoside hydrolase family 18 protein [Cytophagaceae bacterium]